MKDSKFGVPPKSHLKAYSHLLHNASSKQSDKLFNQLIAFFFCFGSITFSKAKRIHKCTTCCIRDSGKELSLVFPHQIKSKSHTQFMHTNQSPKGLRSKQLLRIVQGTHYHLKTLCIITQKGTTEGRTKELQTNRLYLHLTLAVEKCFDLCLAKVFI